MPGPFEAAGAELLARLKAALVDEAKTIMRESMVVTPISGPDTYVEVWGTQYRTIEGRPVFFGNEDDQFIEGDEGTLRRSARVFAPVETPASIHVEMGYGFGEEINPAGRLASEYAVPVHERGELHHDPPTKDHYLVDPVLAHADTFETDLAVKMKTELPLLPHGPVVADGIDLGAPPA